MNGDGLGIAGLHLARFRSGIYIMTLQCAEDFEDYALNLVIAPLCVLRSEKGTLFSKRRLLHNGY